MKTVVYLLFFRTIYCRTGWIWKLWSRFGAGSDFTTKFHTSKIRWSFQVRTVVLEWRLLRWVQSWVYLCQRVVFESCAYRGNYAAFCLTDMIEIVQHKEILRRHMPEALRLAVAKNIENRLFSQATSPILCGPMSIRVKFPDVFLSYVLSAVLC